MYKKPSAKAKAVAFLSRREHSQTELIRKLGQSGYSPSEIEEAMQWANRHGIQSEERFAASLVRRRSRNYGDRAIHAELSQHGVPAPGKLQDVEEGIQPEADRILDHLNRRFIHRLTALYLETESLDKEALFSLKIRVFRSMSAKGFEQNNIETAWKRFVDEFLSDQ